MKHRAFGLHLTLLLLSLAVLGYRGSATAEASFAQNLSVQQECNGASTRVTFNWTASRSGPQWLDLSLYNNGFGAETFVGAGPFEAAAQSFTWEGLLSDEPHFARINTLSGSGWGASNTVAFRTLNCAGVTGVAPGPGMQDLQARLQQRIASANFNVAVAVTDLQTGEQISVNGDVQHLPACATNFLAILRVVMDLQEGRYPEAWVGDLISSTIWSSNPVTGRELLRIARGGQIPAAIGDVNNLMQLLGMTSSFYDHPPAYPHETTAGRNNYLTANDTNRALTAFWQGRVTTLPWRDYLLNKMVEVKPGLQYLLPAGVGDGRTSHKNGFLVIPSGWVDNDIGIITFERGGMTYAYAISFFTQNVPAKYADIPLGQAVSAMAWEYFSTRYP